MYNFNHPPILYFHSVAPNVKPDWIRSYLTFELKYFIDLLKFIKRKKLKTFFISEMDNAEFTQTNSIGLSFDDGYLDNFVYVFPYLKKYGIKATIFCSTDYIDKITDIRPTLEDIWNKKAQEKDLKSWGFCNLKELKLMESSGLVDVQSHTKSHDKIPVSDRIVGFHNPGNKNINFYFSENLGIKPYYINENIINKIPFGYPLFEEKSALKSPRVWINEEYIAEITKSFNNYDFNNYSFDSAMNHIQDVWNKYINGKNTILKTETNEEYNTRITQEISYSKSQLEQQLNKTIEVICWPHGDFTQKTIDIARGFGYKKIHFVSTKTDNKDISSDYFVRIGVNSVRNNRYLTLQTAKFRIYSFINKFPYKQAALIKQYLKKRYA